MSAPSSGGRRGHQAAAVDARALEPLDFRRGRPPGPVPRRGGVRITPADRDHVHRAIVRLTWAGVRDEDGDATAQARAIRRLLLSWQNRQRRRT